jgi:hypothetical protein
MLAVKWRFEVGEIRMAVIPADKGGAAIDAGQITTGNVELAIIGCAGRQHDGVIQALQLINADILADGHIADKAHIFGQGHFLITARHCLDRLMVRRDAETDQSIREPVAGR